MKAIKRERYGQKELTRLQEMLKKAKEEEGEGKTSDSLFKIITPVNLEDQQDEPMKDVRIYDEKTMRDQHGNYPPWMNKKKLKALKRNKGKSSKKRGHK